MFIRVSFKKVFLYLLPVVLFVTTFFIFPMFFIVPISFFSWDGISRMSFIGFGNYFHLWNDPGFRTAFVNTLYWIISAIFLHVPFGLFIALVLNRQPWGWRFLRAIFFLPNILSVASLAILWYFLFNPSFGLINGFFNFIGLDSLSFSWLANPKTALISTQLPFILYIGFTMLIFYANITTIPLEYYEAAKIDGASSWQQDLYITLPLLRKAIVINIIFNVTFVLRMVEYPLIMTGGGPSGITMTLPLYLYRQMAVARAYGITMATGFITFIIGMGISGLTFVSLHYLGRRWE